MALRATVPVEAWTEAATRRARLRTGHGIHFTKPFQAFVKPGEFTWVQLDRRPGGPGRRGARSWSRVGLGRDRLGGQESRGDDGVTNSYCMERGHAVSTTAECKVIVGENPESVKLR